MTSNVDKIIRKVHLLINKAHSTDSEHEREALQNRADMLMREYALETWQVDEAAQRAGRARSNPVIRKYWAVQTGLMESEVGRLFRVVGTHLGVEVVRVEYGKNAKKRTEASMTDLVLFGFQSDVEWFQILSGSLLLDVIGKVEPAVDPKKTFDENVLVLHDAGVNWRRISAKLDAAGGFGVTGWPEGGRLIRAYRRECKRIGQIPIVVTAPITAQRSAFRGYTHAIHERLDKLRKARAAATPGTSVVLANRHDLVLETMESSMKTSQPTGDPLRKTRNEAAYNRGRDAGMKARLTANDGDIQNRKQISL